MYNEEQKRRYMKFLGSKVTPWTAETTVSLFNQTETYEEMFGKDVSCFTQQDISNMYAMFGYRSQYSYSTTNSKLSMYTEWCLDEMLVPDGCNHFQEFTKSDFHNYINKRVLQNSYMTEREIDDFVGKIPNPRDKFVIQSLFEFGKSPDYDEIFSIRLQDVNVEERTVKLCTGRTVAVSRKWIKIAQDADAETEYYMPRRGFGIPYLPSETIFKDTKMGGMQRSERSVHANNKRITKLFKTLVDYTGVSKDVNSATIALSGQFEMIRRRAEELGITKEEYVMQHYEELGNQYNVIKSGPRYYLNRYGAYL